MTKDWYKQNGFELSAYIDDAVIERAENEVTEAYVNPIVGGATIAEETRQRVIGSLAFLLMLQRTIFATRAGAKVKTGYNSNDATEWQKLGQHATTCALLLEKLRQYGANPNAEVFDICRIYFKSNFISM